MPFEALAARAPEVAKNDARGTARDMPNERPIQALFFGRILSYKGLDMMLEALLLIRAQRPDVELEIWGSGDLAAYRDALTRAQGARPMCERAPGRFVGMFAFALWDRQTRTLHLVRDRLSVKPLYWALINGHLLFGSELKALMAHPAWHGAIDPEAAPDFVRHSYVPGPANILTKHVAAMKACTYRGYPETILKHRAS